MTLVSMMYILHIRCVAVIIEIWLVIYQINLRINHSILWIKVWVQCTSYRMVYSSHHRLVKDVFLTYEIIWRFISNMCCCWCFRYWSQFNWYV